MFIIDLVILVSTLVKTIIFQCMLELHHIPKLLWLRTNYVTSTYGKIPSSSHAYIGSKFSILQCVLKICKYISSPKA